MREGRTTNSVKNIMFSMGNQLLGIVLGFVSRSVFLYCLDVTYLGIQGLFSDILTMLSMADLGFGTAMTFSMYKPLAEKDYDKLAGLTSFYKKIYRIIALSITVIGILLAPFLKYIVNTETEIPHLTLYYLMYLANAVASYLVVYKTCIISADQKSYIITKYRSIFSTIQTVVSSVFLLITRNYTVYLFIQVLFTYSVNFFNSHIAEQNYPYIKKNIKLPKEEMHEIFNNIKSVFLYKVSGVLINATDNTLISVIVGTAAVGYYSNYTMIVTKLTVFVNALFYSLTASLGNLIVMESKGHRYRIFRIMQVISNMLSIFCVTCVLFLEQDFIALWLGSEYQLDNTVVYAMVLNFYLSIALLPIWVFREATGLYRKTKYMMVLTALVNVASSIILGKLIGLAGIILATSFSRLVTYFWYEPKLLFKEYFGKSCIVYFVGLAKSSVILLIVFAVAWLISNAITVTGIFSFILKGAVIALVSTEILYLFYRKTEGMKLLRNSLKSLME